MPYYLPPSCHIMPLYMHCRTCGMIAQAVHDYELTLKPPPIEEGKPRDTTMSNEQMILCAESLVTNIGEDPSSTAHSKRSHGHRLSRLSKSIGFRYYYCNHEVCIRGATAAGGRVINVGSSSYMYTQNPLVSSMSVSTNTRGSPEARGKHLSPSHEVYSSPSFLPPLPILSPSSPFSHRWARAPATRWGAQTSGSSPRRA